MSTFTTFEEIVKNQKMEEFTEIQICRACVSIIGNITEGLEGGAKVLISNPDSH